MLEDRATGRLLKPWESLLEPSLPNQAVQSHLQRSGHTPGVAPSSHRPALRHHLIVLQLPPPPNPAFLTLSGSRWSPGTSTSLHSSCELSSAQAGGRLVVNQGWASTPAMQIRLVGSVTCRQAQGGTGGRGGGAGGGQGGWCV